ncbi:beta-ketoacyl-ACP synthase III [Taibaiella koreensis]|uniref:beta-ketoacyl-ACP synthase III n=1 Tax=Taibaiella koreensis TaxID=1268548 RepID=UPI000E599C73|nr:beta-ketoacyl-ACP synthase III [Taibaiella koreensis]
MQAVYITRMAKYLPYDPVSNEDMESVLGMVDGKPSKVRALILRNNGIKTRYYAFREGQKSFSNAELTAEAIKALFKEDSMLDEVQLLACGTTSPDQTLPSHASMVHGLLGVPPLELFSFSGACNTGMQSFKYAFLSVASGDTDNAVSTGSERMSKYLTSDKFQAEIDKAHEIEENGYIAFEKDFLRWMLSDGAGAAFFQNKPNPDGLSLRVEWIDMTSFAGEIETCMYSGSIKEGDQLIGYNELPTDEWLTQSVFSMKQDTRLLGEHIVPRGVDFLEQVMKKRSFDTREIDWFLPHLSSEFFRRKISEELERRNIPLPLHLWYTNLDRLGNVGSASPYFMLEELMNQDKLKKGQKVFLMVPESARFSYTYALLTVV